MSVVRITQTTKKLNRYAYELIIRIKAITYSLLSVGDYISEQDHIDDVLNGLPKEYNTFFMQVYGHLDPSTMYDVEVIIHFQQAQLDKFKKELSVSNVT